MLLPTASLTGRTVRQECAIELPRRIEEIPSVPLIRPVTDRERERRRREPHPDADSNSHRRPPEDGHLIDEYALPRH